jgi:hypothetical protein
MHWLKHADLIRSIVQNVLLSCILLLSVPVAGQRNSVLSSGKWYKLAVTQTGVHKIDINLLRGLGIDPAGLNPARIQIYGNGGAMLPQRNASVRTNDLVQNAIMVQGEEDGKFDAGDKIFFFAEGPHVVAYDSVRAAFQHQTNIYTDTSYYFLTVGNTNGLRIKNGSGLSGIKGKNITEFIDYWYHEKESVNMLRSGRTWWGEYLGSSAFTLLADLPGLVPSSPVKFMASAMGAAQVNTRFLWQLNGQAVGESSVGRIGSSTYDIKGIRSDIDVPATLGASVPAGISVGVTYDRNGQSSALAYLNYISIQVRRELRPYDKQQVYRFLPEERDTVTYQISNAKPDWMFWNVTDPLNPSSVLLSAASSSVSAADGKRIRQYVGFSPAQAYEPVAGRQIENQSIASYDVPDLLIVTADLWAGEAKRLASFRKEKDKLETLVVTTSQIYNEYASGKPDLSAIRDFARSLYLRNPSRFKYLLLLGDATYDYKNNLGNQTQSQQNGWIPVYESRESLNPVYTYSSDDYYGFMKRDDGDWVETVSGDHTMDIGVGRLPVKTLSEARNVVDKLIRYGSGKSAMGSWRNTISFVADDGDGNIHQRHADQLARLSGQHFMSSRIFLDAYPQTTTDAGQKAPGVNAAIRKGINNGNLVLNYTGHGGTSGWAEEQVLTLSDMLSARGLENLPLLLTATCDFGRYDDPGLVSGAELMVLSPKGAAIGAVSTTRPVYSSTNFTINKSFYESLASSGTRMRLGDIVRETKNNALVGALNRNFALLGDPSMRLAVAEKKVRWLQKADTLRALQKVKLELEVYDQDSGLRDNQFTGTAKIAVYDKESSFKTFGNEGDPESYSEFASKLFDGLVTVRNGVMRCEFTMPKNIDYRIGTGRINVYAVQSDSLTDAAGQLDVLVGGSSTLVQDNTPPQITAYLNDASFKDGDAVEDAPLLIVKLSDENGINLSRAGIGHDITLTVNDTLVIVLNDYYISELDQYRSGTIVYPFEELPTGKYTIRIKVWDTYTNSSEIAFGFQVRSAGGIKLIDRKVYPNPFYRDLSFELSHNRVNEDVEVTFRMLLSTGQQLGSHSWQYYNSEQVIKESVTSTHLRNLLTPMNSFIYTIEIRSLKDNSVDRHSGKIIRSP